MGEASLTWGGVCVQHAVTFAAGLATEGMIPVCAIYSSFLQRGYDQVVHDVALQSLPGQRLSSDPVAALAFGSFCV